MNIKTKELMDVCWAELTSQPHLNGYQNRAEFEEVFETLESVKGDGTETYFTRESIDQPFMDGNCQVINVVSPRDYEKVLVPAFTLGGADYE